MAISNACLCIRQLLVSFTGMSFFEAAWPRVFSADEGEDASSAALSSIAARLTAANTLLRDVAAVQRHAEALCPGEHRISDVLSEYSLDDAESSHAVHAEPNPNSAELSEAELSHAEPAIAGVGERQSSSSGWAETLLTPAAMATCTAASASTASLLEASEAAAFQNSLDTSSSRSSASGTVQPQPVVTDGEASGLEAQPSAPAAEMPECALPGVGSPQPTAVEGLPPALGPQESPLPAMMSELQEAMTASVCSAGRLAAKSTHCLLYACLARFDQQSFGSSLSVDWSDTMRWCFVHCGKLSHILN